jgi:hypothetical protein
VVIGVQAGHKDRWEHAPRKKHTQRKNTGKEKESNEKKDQNEITGGALLNASAQIGGGLDSKVGNPEKGS